MRPSSPIAAIHQLLITSLGSTRIAEQRKDIRPEKSSMMRDASI
jgi:hypothetical protein